MVQTNKAGQPLLRRFAAYGTALLIWITACSPSAGLATREQEVELRIGVPFGNAANPEAGTQQAVANMAVEGLIDFQSDGRPRPWLADKWSSSDDGLTWHVSIKPNASFHDGEPVTATAVRDILVVRLPQYLGEPFDDISEIRAASERELVFRLKRPSALLLEGLEVPISKPGIPVIGTGPFQATADVAEMRANPHYYGNKPFIDKLIFRTYPSVRAAWADMLRGRVDMLYEVGVDALDSLQRSSEIKVFTFARPYIYAVFLNVQKTPFQSATFRRALNSAINREELIATALDGHGTAADGPIPPRHWAGDPNAPRFTYAPRPIATGSQRIRSTCIFGERSLERLALTVQRQLQSVGLDLDLEFVDVDPFLSRLQSGDFDCAVGAVISGPSLVRPYWVWHSGGPFNWGKFESRNVDIALDSIRHAANDEEYKAGVAAFQRAVIADPPAIFLAWGERARAVSTRFEVPDEPGRDILGSLRLWRPGADNPIASPN
jgi:ABC-type transport system substrate-binding protein